MFGGTRRHACEQAEDVGLETDRVDHQCLVFPASNRMPEARGFYIGRMFRVEMDDAFAKVSRVIEANHDLVIADFYGA